MIIKDQNIIEPKAIRLLTVLTFFTGIIVLIYLILFSDVKVHHDCAYFLQIAQLLLKGNIPYVDYIGLNPPLANYLHVFPVILASVVKINIPLSFYITVTFLTLFSSAHLYILLSKADTFKLFTSRFIPSVMVVLISLMVLAWGNYGQREHLFVLGYIPFLFLREARYRGKSFPLVLTVSIGLMMSLFALLKPHFVFVVFVVEIWLLLRTRNWKCLLAPEVLITAIIGSAYLLHFLFVPRSMFNAFFYRWIPFVRSHYDVYNTTRINAFFFFSILKTSIIFIGTLSAFYFIRMKTKSHHMLIESLLIAAISGYGIYVFQHKGWLYHIIPFTAFLMLFWIVVLFVLLENLNIFLKNHQSIWRQARTLFILVILVSLNLKYIQYGKRTMNLRDTYYPFLSAFLNTIEKHSQTGDTVTFIATGMIPVYPTVLYADRLPGSRYILSFPIAMLYEGINKNDDGSFPYRTQKNWIKEERQILEELGEDILNNRPKIIFIHAMGRNQACPYGFCIYDYLEQSGWLDKYFNEYDYYKSLEEFKIYIHRS